MNCYFNELVIIKYKSDASDNVYETKVPLSLIDTENPYEFIKTYEETLTLLEVLTTEDSKVKRVTIINKDCIVELFEEYLYPNSISSMFNKFKRMIGF
jgi:hypothetical protein